MKQKTMAAKTLDSPRRTGTLNSDTIAVPNTAGKSMMKGKRRPLPTKAELVQEDKTINYEDATSVRMKNSYLIKNENASFERSYANLRKKALNRAGGSID